LLHLSEADAWLLAVLASEEDRKSASVRASPNAVVRLYLEGCRVVRGLAGLLPQRDDGGFEAYARRLELTTGRRYSFVINEAQTLSWDLFDWAIDAARLFRAERPGLLADLGMFSGNDRHSPFGVHRDEGYFGVRQFVLAGEKRAWFWDTGRLSEEQRSSMNNAADFEFARPMAEVVDVRAGQAVTWSGDAYHVLETTSDHSVAFSLALRPSEVAGDDCPLATTFHEVVEEAFLADDPKAMLEERVGTARRRVIEHLFRDADVQRRTLARALRRATSCGFVHTPPLRRQARPADAILYRKPASPIRWVRCASDLLFACCGHYFEVETAPPWVEAFLAAVEASRKSALPDLCRAAEVPVADHMHAEAIVDGIFAANGLGIVAATEESDWGVLSVHR
jgi:hypothetical protein